MKTISRIGLMGLLMIAILILMSVSAVADGRLYKNYQFGMSEADLTATNAVIYDCSEEVGESGWLCLDRQEFAGYEVGIAFGLLDSSLVTVALSPETTWSEQQYLDLFTALASQFQMVGISSGDEHMDILAERHEQPEAVLMQQLGEFEAVALNRGDIVYTFVERTAFESAGSKAKNYTDFMMKAADDFRAAEYSINEGDTGDVISIIRFTLPNSVRRFLTEKMQRDVGDF